MNAQHYFAGKTIVITGGSSGIGYALAKDISQYRPKALILLSHEAQKLQAAADQLQQLTPAVQVAAVCADISNSQASRFACESIMAKFGTPDILINNAGYAHYLLFHEMSIEEIERHIDVNLTGAMRITHAFLASMRTAKRGQIVNIASIAGHMVITPNLVYGTAKHGMVAWSEGLATELANDGITVQVISPGRVITDFFRHESFQKRVTGKETRLTVPMQKVVTVAIAAIIKQKKITIVPSYWSFVAWVLHACPRLMKPLYHHLLQKRVARLKATDETK